jgi:dGTPase
VENLFYNPFDLEHLPGSRPEGDHRTPFQIDRDRILFSYAFRRLQSKTQVFQSGEYDFYRTRLTHSIEVARIGRSICDFLRSGSEVLPPDSFIDPDLVEAVGLAHDIGHPPFGHVGERKLNQLMGEYGGFEGNAQTLRILTEIIYERTEAPRGMSPTRAFLDGVLKYKRLFSDCGAPTGEGLESKPRNHFIYDDQEPYLRFVLGEIGSSDQAPLRNTPKSIECQIMDWADDTAYSLHDIQDGIKAGFLDFDRMRQWARKEAGNLPPGSEAHIESLGEWINKGIVEAVFSNKIGGFIRACRLYPDDNAMGVLSNRYAYRLHIDNEVLEECALYKKIAYDLIFRSPQIQQIEFKSGFILEKLFTALVDNYLGAGPGLNILPENVENWIRMEETPSGKARRICDFLAGLTDGFAIRMYKRLFDPDFGSFVDLM